MVKRHRLLSLTMALVLLLCCVAEASAAILDVKPQNPGSFVRIVEVTLSDNGTPVVQDSEESSVEDTRNTPINLVSIVVDDNDTDVVLDPIGSTGAEVILQGFANSGVTGAGSPGVGVLSADGTQVLLKNGKSAFQAAATAALSNTDLNNYIFYDTVQSGKLPGASVPDFDVMYERGLRTDEYLLVMERWGNTYLTMVPLDDEGQEIGGANTLRFGYPTGSAYAMYDWNTGYANSEYVANQAYALTVARVSAFFDETEVPLQDRVVYGLRIDNNGEADPKIILFKEHEEPPVDPDPEGTITVTVVKTDGRDVGNIPVTFGGGLGATLHTNASGKVTVTGLWAGTYTANASDGDYTSDGPKTITLPTNSSNGSATITLTPVPPPPPDPGPGAIEGKTEDEITTSALPGVLVRLLDSTDTIIGMTMSDPDGEFAFTGLQPGSYAVRGSLDGYGTDTEVAVVVHDDTTNVLLELAAVIIVPPAPPAVEPGGDLPKTGASITGLLLLGGILIAAGRVQRRK